MSLLRNVVLEASSHTQTKTVFRIPSAGKLLMPELRLCNFGVTTGGTADGLETYAYAQGIFALIKAVRLYSNNILIDQCQDCGRYLSLMNLAGSTSGVYDVHQQTLCSNVNLAQYGQFSGLKVFLNTKLLGRLDLSDVLPFLDSMPMLYDMPELRVEIEYYTNKNDIFSNDGNVQDAGFTFTVNQPTMIYTQEMDDGKVSSMKGEAPQKAAWFAWEREYIQGLINDSLSVPRVRAFDNKFVNTLVVQKLFADAPETTGLLKNGRSDVLGNNRVNFVLNGKKLLPLNGHDTPARAMAQVADLMGDLVVPFNAWQLMAPAANQSMLKDLSDLSGGLSWDAVSIGTTVNRLDMEFYYSDARADLTDVWVWGQVLKFMTITPSGQIVVGYQS